MKLTTGFLSAATLALSAWAPSTMAAFTEYLSYTDWQNAINYTQITENFNDLDLEPIISSISLAETASCVGTGCSIPIGVNTAAGIFTDRVSGTYPNGDETVFSFSEKVEAIGGFWDTDINGGGVALNLYADGVLVSTMTPTIPSTATGSFFGFTSTVLFDEFVIAGNGSGVETYSLVDMHVSAVPIPAALPLFLSALLGVGIIGRRKRSSAVAA